MVKGWRPTRRGLQVCAVVPNWYVSDGHLDESAEGAPNWWELLEKVAIIVGIDLL